MEKTTHQIENEKYEKEKEQIENEKRKKARELLEAHNDKSIKKICQIDENTRAAVRELTQDDINDLNRLNYSKQQAVRLLQMTVDTLNDLMRELD